MHTLKFLLLLLVFLVACQLISCTPESIPQKDFNIIVISDTHISRDESKDNRLKNLIFDINNGALPNVHLLFNTGDAVSRIYGDYTPANQDSSDDRVQRYLDILELIEIPAFTALGNHDYKIGSYKDSDDPFSLEEIQQAEQIWQTKGSVYPYYSIDYNGWKFIVLNTMRGTYVQRNFDPGQLDWLKQELAQNIPAVLFFHHPVETDNFRIWASFEDLITPDKEPEFFDICQNHRNTIKAIFVGHGHMWTKDTLFDSIQVFETASFADDEDSPFYLAGLDTTLFKIEVVASKDLDFSAIKAE
jgi:3',5'-cyclic AMP phosphodiesterase CpdA